MLTVLENLGLVNQHFALPCLDPVCSETLINVLRARDPRWIWMTRKTANLETGNFLVKIYFSNYQWHLGSWREKGRERKQICMYWTERPWGSGWYPAFSGTSVSSSQSADQAWPGARGHPVTWPRWMTSLLWRPAQIIQPLVPSRKSPLQEEGSWLFMRRHMTKLSKWKN